MHGGTVRRGIASPNFKHGDRSKYWPKGLRQSYLEARADPELRLVTKELGIVAARIDELLSSAGPDGALTDAVWTQIYAFLELKAKLASAESTIIRQRQRAYTPDEVTMMLEVFIDAVRDADPPPEVLERASRALDRIMGERLPILRPEDFPPAWPAREDDDG